MEYNTEINITDNLAQRFVEQGFAIKESEILSFIITKADDTILDIVETFEERETTKVVYAWDTKRNLQLLYSFCVYVLVACCFILLGCFINQEKTRKGLWYKV